MADVALFMADLALGLLLGCVFAVIAHGLNLIWGVAKVVNVAHGEVIMLGAYRASFPVAFSAFPFFSLTRRFWKTPLRASARTTPPPKLVALTPPFPAPAAPPLGFCFPMAGGPLLPVWLPRGFFPAMGNLYAPIS